MLASIFAPSVVEGRRLCGYRSIMHVELQTRERTSATCVSPSPSCRLRTYNVIDVIKKKLKIELIHSRVCRQRQVRGQHWRSQVNEEAGARSNELQLHYLY